MTLTELREALNLSVFCEGADPQRPVAGGYCGDLLSWVMGRAQADSAWITIMSNRNVAAVAAMADLSCVVLSEGVRPEEELLARARTEGLALYGAQEDTFTLAGRLAEALK